MSIIGLFSLSVWLAPCRMVIYLARSRVANRITLLVASKFVKVLCPRMRGETRGFEGLTWWIVGWSDVVSEGYKLKSIHSPWPWSRSVLDFVTVTYENSRLVHSTSQCLTPWTSTFHGWNIEHSCHPTPSFTYMFSQHHLKMLQIHDFSFLTTSTITRTWCFNIQTPKQGKLIN